MYTFNVAKYNLGEVKHEPMWPSLLHALQAVFISRSCVSIELFNIEK